MPESENLFIRVNGRGNAWPVFLGAENPHYDRSSSEDLANASYSLLGCNSNKYSSKNVIWEVVIDSGHHTVPYLIQNGNRIPEAIVLTHGHMDHTLGIDWIAQSKYNLSGKKLKLSLYATNQVWEFVKQSYPHLKNIISYKELLPGVGKSITEVTGLHVTAYPVFHGPNAKGASMLLFEKDKKRLVFTGDMLCPLLRKKDFNNISGIEIMYVDANNRFPYPKSNHESITDIDPGTGQKSSLLTTWLSELTLFDLFEPHQSIQNGIGKKYFEELLSDYKSIDDFTFTILNLVKRVKPKNVFLVHYSGFEDVRCYQSMQLTREELKEWIDGLKKKEGIKDTVFSVPPTGDIYQLKE